jgi:hypothetical protein
MVRILGHRTKEFFPCPSQAGMQFYACKLMMLVTLPFGRDHANGFFMARAEKDHY